VRLLLDTNVLAPLCHPAKGENYLLAQWVESLLRFRRRDLVVYVPAISDYELRRGLHHVALKHGRSTTRSLQRLDRLSRELDYLPIRRETLEQASRLWADARHAGKQTSAPHSLDGDVILAAQAIEVDGVVVTENLSHLSRFVTSYRWHELPLRS